MMIIFILIYFLPILVVAAIDQSVAFGMIILTLVANSLINLLTETQEGKFWLLAIWTILYYAIAFKMLMERLGYSLEG